MKICSICKTKKLKSEYGLNKSRKDGRQSYCKQCSRLKDRKHYKNSLKRRKAIRDNSRTARKRNIFYILEYLNEHPCLDCGETDPIVLDFDHRSDKVFNVTSAVSYSLNTVKREIAKCDIRCANCHRRKTAKEFNYFRYKKVAGVL